MDRPKLSADLAALMARRRDAARDRQRLAEDRWTRFQAASRRRYGPRMARIPPVRLGRLLARGKWPGRVMLLAASGLWHSWLEEGLSAPGDTCGLTAYVRAGPDRDVQPKALFDQAGYIARTPGIAASAWAPLAHYLVLGDREGRDPHPLFDVAAYRALVGGSLGRPTALQHFLFRGAAEGLNPHPLFDLRFYVGRSEDVAASGENPLVHYLRKGWREGLDPHPLFAGAWYLSRYPEAAAAGIAPLLHYVNEGAAKGFDPHPLFDTAWWTEQAGGRVSGEPLADFLRTGGPARKSPTPHFNPAYYVQQLGGSTEVQANPLLHYLTIGAFDGAWPAPDFDEGAYVAAHPVSAESGLSALDHWLRHGTTRPDPSASSSVIFSPEALAAQIRAASTPDPFAYDWGAYEALSQERRRITPHPVRSSTAATVEDPQIIALRVTAPQDWQAVAGAKPNWRGHLQPRLPGDLGAYDPAEMATLRRQAALAERYGLGGFCHEVADVRTASLAWAADAPTFPFCLAWIGDDTPEVLTELGAGLTASNAIRIEGRPVLLLAAEATAPGWRQAAQSAGLPRPYLVQRGGPVDTDPRTLGFDARLETPPTTPPVRVNGPSFNSTFRGEVHDYRAVVRASFGLAPPPWPHIQTVRPGYDATPVQPDTSTLLHDASPGAFQAWLEWALERSPRAGPRLVFIDAWNDWMHGAALEPDRRLGHGWLEAVANALDRGLLER